jgi:hypothetical protein
MLQRLFNSISRRGTTLEERAFAVRVVSTLDTVRGCCDDWSEQVAVSADYAALANLAAVRRWELTRAAQELSALAPPSSLRREAEESARAILQVADGFRRLTQGYRFSKFERVCEGQSLLESGLERCRRSATRFAVIRPPEASSSRGALST